MTIDKLAGELQDILRVEIRSFSALLESLILEEQCLVSCDTVELANIVGRQEDVISSIACLEKSRIELVERIAQETGMHAEMLHISTIATLVDDEHGKDLLDSMHVLRGLKDEIRKKKQTNTVLIKQSLMMVESDVRLMVGMINGESAPAVYSHDARPDSVGRSMRVDQRG